jgi:hypothetical protein
MLAVLDSIYATIRDILNTMQGRAGNIMSGLSMAGGQGITIPVTLKTDSGVLAKATVRAFVNEGRGRGVQLG